MFDNHTDNHTDIEAPLYDKLRFTKLKSPENFAKSKTRKNNHQNSENTIFAKKRNLYWEVYSEPSTYQIWRIYLDL